MGRRIRPTYSWAQTSTIMKIKYEISNVTEKKEIINAVFCRASPL